MMEGKEGDEHDNPQDKNECHSCMTPEPNFGLFDFQSNSLDFLNTLYYLEMG
jgi:hypothetical protein